VSFGHLPTRAVIAAGIPRAAPNHHVAITPQYKPMIVGVPVKGGVASGIGEVAPTTGGKPACPP